MKASPAILSGGGSTPTIKAQYCPRGWGWLASNCGNKYVDLKLTWFRSELGFGSKWLFPSKSSRLCRLYRQ